MKGLLRIRSTVAMLFPLGGCSAEAVKRTSFESLQTLRELQCSRDLSGNCPPRGSYEAYQRQRKVALDGGEAEPPASP